MSENEVTRYKNALANSGKSTCDASTDGNGNLNVDGYTRELADEFEIKYMNTVIHN